MISIIRFSFAPNLNIQEMKMKKIITRLSAVVVLAMLVGLPALSHATYPASRFATESGLTLTASDCGEASPENYFFEAATVDSLGQTTYTLLAPCKVFLDEAFKMMITVQDGNCAGSAFWPTPVASTWSLDDESIDKVTSAHVSDKVWEAGSYWTNTLALGPTAYLEKIYDITYTGTAYDHNVAFNVVDMGYCDGFHSTLAISSGHIVVDPVRGGANTAPVVDAGLDTIIASEDQGMTVITGTATDAEGDALTYTWSEGGVVVASGDIDALGNATLDLSLVPLLGVGAHTYTLDVSDGTDTGSDAVTVSVENTAPAAVSSGSGTYQYGDDIALGGTISDYDGDLLDYTWTVGSEIVASGSVLTAVGGGPVALPIEVLAGGLTLGDHLVDLTVTDGIYTVSASAISVSVVDSEAPTLAPTATPNLLTPPKKQMVDVVVEANAFDNTGGYLTIDVAIASNESPKKDDDDDDDGDDDDDDDSDDNDEMDYIVVSVDQETGTAYLQLRAEKGKEKLSYINEDGKKKKKHIDRTYTITVTATDLSGNTSSADVIVTVPRDKKDKRDKHDD